MSPGCKILVCVAGAGHLVFLRVDAHGHDRRVPGDPVHEVAGGAEALHIAPCPLHADVVPLQLDSGPRVVLHVARGRGSAACRRLVQVSFLLYLISAE